MRKERCKWLKKLLLKNDENIISQIRKHGGKKTVLMTPDKLYRKSKKLWSEGKIK